MTLWQVCHQSGRVLFTMTARNREQFGWKVTEVDKSREQFEAVAANKLNFDISTVVASRNGDTYDSGILSIWWYFWQESRTVLNIELTPVCWRTYYPDTYEETGRAHSESNERCARRIASEIGGYVVPVYHGNPQPSLTPANDIANGTGTE